MSVFVGFTAIIVCYLLFRLYRYHGKVWFSSKEGKGVLFGLLVAPLAAAIIAFLLVLLSGCSSVKVSDSYIEVFAGLEKTKNLSPQCEKGGADDRLTSNLGVNLCAGISEDGGTLLCANYRHHSCAISEDDRSYDAGGIHINRRVYF